MKQIPSILGIFLLPCLVAAQEPAAVRRIGLPDLDTQVRARLVALDARLNPVHGPNLAAGVVANLAAPSPFHAFAPVLGDRRNNEIWEQLAEDYSRLMIESGDALVTMQDAAPLGVGWTSEQVRRLCHERLLSLPRASLEVYRQRIQAEARALLEQGRDKRSPAPLRRLVDELWCSRSNEMGLDLLGDLTFERGEFEEARYWWRLLESGERGTLDPKIDLARIEAKQILATIFQGRLDEAGTQIDRYRQRHPDARGEFAGEDGVYHQILKKTLATFQRERISNNDEPWTTFGGAPSRNRTLTQALPLTLWEDGSSWRAKLPALTTGKFVAPKRWDLMRNVAFHPIIVHNQVLIADHRSVVSYHLKTGVEAFRYDLKSAGLRDPGPGVDREARMPRFTLSADNDRAYVRLGSINVGPRKAGKKDPDSFLVCLDLTEPGKAKKRELWHIQANGADKEPAWFEGSPLVHDERVYAVLSKIVERRVVSTIVCYDVLGRLRWSRTVAESPEFADGNTGPRSRQHLLTLAGGQIVYATQAGAIVAVDARTGEPTWAVRYPSRGPVTREFEPSPRDLAPCVYADGRIYAAPLDVDRLLCIDARSGRVAWEAADVEIVHLLGTAHERIYATTPTGLQAWKLSSGRAEWVQPSEGRLPSLGRGLIAGGWLFWPTQDPNLPFRTVTLKRGMPQRGAGPPSVIPGPDYYDPTMFGKDMIPAGNMAFGQGCLAIAGVHELVVFTPPRLAPVAPGDAKLQARLDSQYQKARALAHVGEIAAAKTAYGELLTVTKTAPHANDWRKLIETRLNVLDPSRVAKAPADAKVTRVQDSADKKQVFHGPNLPLVRAWEQSDGRVWPIDGAERFLCWQPGRITCRKEADGRALWQHKLDFEPTWVKRWRDRVLVIGADGVQAHRIDDGQWLWSFAAPSRGWPQASVLAGIPKIEQHAAGIQHAEIWGDTLLLLDDSRTFLRLRLEDGTVAWQYASPAAPLRPLDAAAFSPHWSRVGERLLVQSVTGQPHVLNTSLTPFGTKARPWLQSPCLADGRVVIAGERGTIAAYDVGDFAMPAWTYRANFATSLTGDLCRLFTQDTVLLAQVPRNRGAEWIRLNPATGKLVWSITPPDEPAATTVCIGDTAFYRVIANQLIARSLNDGTLLWSQSLPVHAEQWALRYTPESLAVYPASAAKDADFAVSLVDPFDGRWQQRLLIPDVRGGGQVLWTSSGAVVSAGGRIFGFRPLGME